MLTALQNSNPSIKKVAKHLSSLYEENVKPLEESYMFNNTHTEALVEGDFTAKPLIITMGQYSTGKSSFIRYLIGQDYPGLRIAAEPTTENFICILHGKDQIIPGNSLILDERLPFKSLSQMESSFFDHFHAATCKSPVLEHLMFMDTPGILGVEKARANRGYDYHHISRWFATKSDMIFLFFDAHSLDINDEFRKVVQTCYGDNIKKVRIVLNKADGFTSLELLRVYGSLMWALGKVFTCPEAVVVYVGSFRDGELQNKELEDLFNKSTAELFQDVAELPATACLRQINDMTKRMRKVKVNACVLNHVAQMTGMQTKTSSLWRRKVRKDLGDIFASVGKQYGIPSADFPAQEEFMEKVIGRIDLNDIPKTINIDQLSALDKMMKKDITILMRAITEDGDFSELEKKKVAVPVVREAPVVDEYVEPITGYNSPKVSPLIRETSARDDCVSVEGECNEAC